MVVTTVLEWLGGTSVEYVTGMVTHSSSQLVTVVVTIVGVAVVTVVVMGQWSVVTVVVDGFPSGSVVVTV